MDRAKSELSSPDPKPQQSDPGQVDGTDFHVQHCFEPTGGDLFDILRVGPRIAFLLSDIAGIRPELDPISAEMRRVFRSSSEELFSAPNMNLVEATELLVHAINQALIEAARGVRFTPTMVGCYDMQLGVLAYINAGGQTALFHDSEGTRVLPNGSVPLGMFTHLPYDASIQAFQPGALLLVMTKGVIEAMAGDDSFDSKRVIEIVRNSKDASASEVCQAVLNAALRFEKRRTGWLPFRGKVVRQDMTALALVRTL